MVSKKLNYIILITFGALINILNSSCNNDKHNSEIGESATSNKIVFVFTDEVPLKEVKGLFKVLE